MVSAVGSIWSMRFWVICPFVCSIQEYFTHMEALPLVLKGCPLSALLSVPFKNILLIWRGCLWCWRAATLRLIPLALELGGIFTVQHKLLWQGASGLRSELKDHTDLVLLATRKGSKVPFLTLIIFETFSLDYNESTFYQWHLSAIST